jgi:hypothetical protein
MEERSVMDRSAFFRRSAHSSVAAIPGVTFHMSGAVVEKNTAIVSLSSARARIALGIPGNCAEHCGGDHRLWERAARCLGVTVAKVMDAAVQPSSSAKIAGVARDRPVEKAGLWSPDAVLLLDGLTMAGLAA